MLYGDENLAQQQADEKPDPETAPGKSGNTANKHTPGKELEQRNLSRLQRMGLVGRSLSGEFRRQCQYAFLVPDGTLARVFIEHRTGVNHRSFRSGCSPDRYGRHRISSGRCGQHSRQQQAAQGFLHGFLRVTQGVPTLAQIASAGNRPPGHHDP